MSDSPGRANVVPETSMLVDSYNTRKRPAPEKAGKATEAMDESMTVEDANESPRRTRKKSNSSLAGPSESQPVNTAAPTSIARVWDSENQRKGVEEFETRLRLYDYSSGIVTVFVPALVAELPVEEEAKRAAVSKARHGGGETTEGKQEDGNGKGKEGKKREDGEGSGEKVSILSMRCFLKTDQLPGTPELQLSGIRKEWSKSTRDHYQVALSHLKATWQVYTEQLRVHARHSPFTVGQSIFMTVGDGRHLTIDKSATAAAFLSLFARFTKVLFRADCAVTAELSLSGQLLPVGSVEVKLRGAKENGMKRVVVSRDDYARLPDVWKEDKVMEVLQARTAYELIRLCHDENELTVGLPLKDISKVEAPFFTAHSWYNNDTITQVEATAYPGSGRLIITGLEQNDPKKGYIDTWNPRSCTYAALQRAMHYLESQQEERWFQQLPSGPRRLDLKRRMLIKDRDEYLADIHIHFPQDIGSPTVGLAIVVALAQLMRGRKTKLRAWYRGCVQTCGTIFPVRACEEEVTREDVDVLIVPECMGDGKFGHPKNVPEGAQTVGFAFAAPVIEYIYQARPWVN